MNGSTEAVERSIRQYPVYLFFQKASYWGPVFFLYFNSLLSLSDVLLLEAIYYFAVVMLEIPTGYLADRVGPRRVLIASSLSQVAACAAFVSSGEFLILAGGQVLLGLGMSLGSGSDTAYHYALVRSVDREEEFKGREGRAARAILLSQASAALLGGLAAAFDLRLAYVLTIVSSGIAAGLAIRFVEVDSAERSRESVGRQLVSCIRDARHPTLAWLLSFYVFMTVVNHIPHEFYQPFIERLVQSADTVWSAPVVTGIHTALTMALAAVGAAYSVRLSDRIGTFGALLLAAAIQVTIIAAMALLHAPIITLLILLRSTPRGLMYAPLNAAIVPLIGEGRRATYLSLQSLLGRLGFAGLLYVFSVSFTGDQIAGPLFWSMQGAVIGLALLALTIPLARYAARR